MRRIAAKQKFQTSNSEKKNAPPDVKNKEQNPVTLKASGADVAEKDVEQSSVQSTASSDAAEIPQDDAVASEEQHPTNKKKRKRERKRGKKNKAKKESNVDTT